MLGGLTKEYATGGGLGGEGGAVVTGRDEESVVRYVGTESGDLVAESSSATPGSLV